MFSKSVLGRLFIAKHEVHTRELLEHSISFGIGAKSRIIKLQLLNIGLSTTDLDLLDSDQQTIQFRPALCCCFPADTSLSPYFIFLCSFLKLTPLLDHTTASHKSNKSSSRSSQFYFFCYFWIWILKSNRFVQCFEFVDLILLMPFCDVVDREVIK